MRVEALVAGLLVAAWAVAPAFAEDPYREALAGDAQGVRAGLMGLGQDLEPGNADLVVARAEASQGRLVVVEDRRYIRVRPGDTFEAIAREAYGDPELWFLIYYHNRHFLAAQGDAGQEVVLYLPPPPAERVREVAGQRMLMVIPGDSFTGIASQLYGDPGLWELPYRANRAQLPDPADPTVLFQDPPEALSKIFLIPGATGATRPSLATGPAPRPIPRVAPPTGAGVALAQGAPAGTATPGPTPAPADAAARPLPQSIRDLQLTSADQVGPREAALVLEAAGFMSDKILREHSRYGARTKLEAAMMAISWGNRFQRPKGPVALDGAMKAWIFQEYTQLTAALRRYQGWSEISQKHRPREYEAWVARGATQLTNVPEAQRVALMKSLMSTESGRTHWQGYKPVTSYSGEVGFGQFLPGTARRLGINRYDPAENIAGIAKLVNENLGRLRAKGVTGPAALRQALAQYNGGNKPPQRSYAYADRILARANLA